jgi:hypothetical protein
MPTKTKSWKSSWQIFKDALGLAFDNAGTFLLLLFLQILFISISQGLLYANSVPTQDGLSLVTPLPVVLFVFAFIVFYQVFATLVLFRLFLPQESENLGTVLGAGLWKKFFPYVGLLILLTILISVGSLLLIVPGVIVFTQLALAPAILVLEDVSITEAMKKSRALSKGVAWRILGRLLFLASLEVLIVGLGIIPGPGLFASFLFSMIFFQIAIIYLALTYQDLLSFKKTVSKAKLNISVFKKTLIVIWAIFAFSLLAVFSSLGDFVNEVYSSQSGLLNAGETISE